MKRFPLKYLMLLAGLLTLGSFVAYAAVHSDWYQSNPSSLTTPTDPIDEFGVCKKVTNSGVFSYFIPTKTATEWQLFRDVGNFLPGLSLLNCGGMINLVISADTYNYNIYNQAVSAGWTNGMSVVLTINSGVSVGSTSTGQPGLVTGSFPVGTNVSIINNGYVVGMGGVGGYDLSNGASGGTAFVAQATVSITNSGVIGGGGGGGGGGETCYSPSVGQECGGGGAGYDPGRGGYNPALGGHYCGESWGGVSTLTSGGIGEDQGNGATGGNGGDLGMPGQNGSGDCGGGLGGPAGVAVVGNSYITWVSGNDSTHIKGAIN